MAYFVVTREAGPGWTDELGAFDQPGVADHGAYMNQLAAEGFAVFAGPLGGSEAGRIRVLLIVDAKDEAEVYDRLAGDPWAVVQRLMTSRVDSWAPLVGAERLARVS
jgi:uncharacterized protein YciI